MDEYEQRIRNAAKLYHARRKVDHVPQFSKFDGSGGFLIGAHFFAAYGRIITTLDHALLAIRYGWRITSVHESHCVVEKAR